MFFPISGAHVSPISLGVVGFLIGLLGGFFGVGGSFIAGPALRLVGLDWNFAVGTDLAHIVGKSVVAARRHRALGNIDFRLGWIMAFGTIGGAEVGAQLIQALKRAGNVNLVVSIVSIVVYVSISTFMIWESRKTLASRKGRSQRGIVKGAKSKKDHSAFGLVMNIGAAIGAQIGAISTQYFTGPKIRLAFVPLPLIGAAIVIYTLMTGHKL